MPMSASRPEPAPSGPSAPAPHGGFRFLGEQERYAGWRIRVVEATFESPTGARFTRDVVRHPGAVAVVPVTDRGTALLLRQYRGPLERALLEIPAGTRDPPGASWPRSWACEPPTCSIWPPSPTPPASAMRSPSCTWRPASATGTTSATARRRPTCPWRRWPWPTSTPSWGASRSPMPRPCSGSCWRALPSPTTLVRTVSSRRAHRVRPAGGDWHVGPGAARGGTRRHASRWADGVDEGEALSATAEEFLTWLAVEHGRARNTLQAYRRDLRGYERFLAENGTDPEHATPAAVEGYLAAMAAAGRAPSTRARALAAIRGMHRFRLEEGAGGGDPTADVLAPRPGLRLPKALAEDEVLALLQAVPDDDAVSRRDRAIVELLYGTGMRVSELVGLGLGDLQGEGRR